MLTNSAAFSQSVAVYDFAEAYNSLNVTSNSRAELEDTYNLILADNIERKKRTDETRAEIKEIEVRLAEEDLTSDARETLEAEKRFLEQEVEALERERAEFIERRLVSLQNTASRTTNAIVGTINDEIDDLKTENSFDSVYDLSGLVGDPVPPSLNVNEATNITLEIISRLNRGELVDESFEEKVISSFQSDTDFDGNPDSVELAIGTTSGDILKIEPGSGSSRMLNFSIKPSLRHLLKVRVMRSTNLSEFETEVYASENTPSGLSQLNPIPEDIVITDDLGPEERTYFYRFEVSLRNP